MIFIFIKEIAKREKKIFLGRIIGEYPSGNDAE